jgi:hypothetical protein
VLGLNVPEDCDGSTLVSNLTMSQQSSTHMKPVFVPTISNP